MNQEDKQTILNYLNGIECIINNCCNTGWTIQECDEKQIQKQIDTIKDIIQPPAERVACSHSKECAYRCLHVYGVDNSTCQRCTNESEYLHLGAVLYYLRLGLSNKMSLERALTHDNRNTGFDIHGYPLYQSEAEIEIEKAKYTEQELDELWKPL